MSRERDLLEEIRDELREFLRLLLQALAPRRNPVQILVTYQGVPVASVDLTGTETATFPVEVADVNGTPIAGDVLDPGATAVISDPTVASAVLSADQTSLAVTALDTTSSATVTVSGTFGGATLTPATLTVNTTSSAPPPPVPAEIVLGAPVISGGAAPAAPAAPADATGSGHAPDAGGQAPG